MWLLGAIEIPLLWVSKLCPLFDYTYLTQFSRSKKVEARSGAMSTLISFLTTSLLWEVGFQEWASEDSPLEVAKAICRESTDGLATMCLATRSFWPAARLCMLPTVSTGTSGLR